MEWTPLPMQRTSAPRGGRRGNSRGRQDRHGAPPRRGLRPRLGAWVALGAGSLTLPVLFGLVAGRTALAESLFPLATGYFVALLAAGDRRRALAAALGILAGMATLVPGTRLVEQFFLFAAVWLLASHLRRRRPAPLWVLPAAAVLTAGLIRTVPLLAMGGTAASFPWLGAELTLEFAAALALVPAVRLHQGWPARLAPAQAAGPVLLLAALMWVSHDAALGAYSLDGIIGRWALLLAGVAGGLLAGVVAGLTVGLAEAVAAGGVTLLSGLYAGSGLLAGLGRPYGKPGAIAGLLIAHLLLSGQTAGFTEISAWLVEAGIAAGLCAATPRRVVDRIARVLADMSEPGAAAAGRGGSPTADREVARHLQRISQVFDELARTFGRRMPATGRRKEQDGFQLFLNGVTDRVCAGCRAYRYCWEEHLYYSYRDLVEVAAAAERKGKLGLADLPPGLRSRCVQPQNLLQATQDTAAALRVDTYWQERLEESRELVPRQLQGIAQIVQGLAEQVDRQTTVAAAAEPEANGVPAGEAGGSHKAPPLHLQVAVRRLVKDGGTISGDSHAQVELGAKRMGLILSDGMGAGTPAALESQAAAGMLQRLLEAGFEPEFAVRTVNSVLLLRSSEETFATLDLAIFDLQAGQAEFFKIGAAPTFVQRGREMEVIRSAAPPVGIMSRIDVEPHRTTFRRGDIAVMMTDGVLDALRHHVQGEEGVGQTLRHAADRDPEVMAQRLSERMARANPQGPPDDATLLVARCAAATVKGMLPPPDAVPAYRRGG